MLIGVFRRRSRNQKLVAVLATSVSVTVARKGVVEDSENLRSILAQFPYILYPINFREKSILALFNSDSKVNAVHLTFAKELDLPIRSTDIKVQKIDGTTLDTYGMIVTAFLVTNKTNQVWFFEETFSMANVSPEVVFGMLFFILSDADVDFLD